MKNDLMKLASKYQDKLGLSERTRTAGVELPKSLRKLAKAEEILHKKIAEHRAEFSKVSAGPSVSYSGGLLPASYHVCETCQGVGKLAKSRSVPNVKFASTEEYLSHLAVKKCPSCKGSRVIKAVDDSQCNEEQLLAYAAEEADKTEKKKEKKAKKIKKKIDKLEAKAKNKKLALEAPEEYAALKAEKKQKKTKKRLEKQAKKASKKVEKLKKKFPFFDKKD